MRIYFDGGKSWLGGQGTVGVIAVYLHQDGEPGSVLQQRFNDWDENGFHAIGAYPFTEVPREELERLPQQMDVLLTVLRTTARFGMSQIDRLQLATEVEDFQRYVREQVLQQ